MAEPNVRLSEDVVKRSDETELVNKLESQVHYAGLTETPTVKKDEDSYEDNDIVAGLPVAELKVDGGDEKRTTVMHSLSQAEGDYHLKYDSNLRRINPDTGLIDYPRFWPVYKRKWTSDGRYFHNPKWLLEYSHPSDATKQTRTALKDDCTVRIVLLSVSVRNISELDMVNDTFRVEMVVSCKWLAKPCEIKSYYRAKSAGKKDTWAPPSSPKLLLRNIVRYHSQSEDADSDYTPRTSDSAGLDSGFELLHHHSGIRKTRHMLEANPDINEFAKKLLGFDPCHAWWCNAVYKVDATVAEEMELQTFPFDCQGLSIGISVRKQLKFSAFFLDLVPDFDAIKLHPSLNLLATSTPWDVSGLVVESHLSQIGSSHLAALKKNGVDVAKLTGCSTEAPPRSAEVWFSVKMLRKWNLYAMDVVQVFVVYTISLCVFSLGLFDDLADRLALTVTLMLAISLSKNEDILGYSIIEHYRISLQFFLGALSVWDAMVSVFTSPGGTNWNLIGFFIFLGVYLALHIYFGYRVWFLRNFANSLIPLTRTQTDRAYKDAFRSAGALGFTVPKNLLTANVFEGMTGLTKQDDFDVVISVEQ